jgi:hypothetical protein
MASSPSFISTPVINVVNVSASNTNLNGTGTITTLAAGAVTGTRILEIAIQCAENSSSALLNVFVSIDSGATWRIFDQIAVSSATISGTVKAFRTSTAYNNLVLKDATHLIGVASTVAQSTNVFAFGGNL